MVHDNNNDTNDAAAECGDIDNKNSNMKEEVDSCRRQDERRTTAQNRATLADIEATLDIAEVHFPQVADKSWLACRPFPDGSVLGLAYVDEATGEEILYALQLRTLILDGTRNDPSRQHGLPPRTPSYPMQLPALSSSSSSSAAASTNHNVGAYKIYTSQNQIVWYDLRAYARESVWTSKQVLRLLRNLLGVSHSASPWSPGDSHDESACIVFLFESDGLAEKLMQFRVGDACPSWCLFGHARLDRLPEFYRQYDDADDAGEHRPPSWPGAATGSARDDGDDDDDDPVSGSNGYYMFVFRHLPRRSRMSYRHPITKELPGPVGCLWEAVKDKTEDSWSHRPVAPPYIDVSSEGIQSDGNLRTLMEERNISVLRKEALAFTRTLWTPWPEETHYSAKPDGGAPWSVVPLLHCFPATDPSRRQWIPHFCQLCPGTVEILKRCIGEPNLRTALWSRLDPDSVLEAHTGWADLANHVLRVHIPVVIPAGGVCGTWVDGCVAESSDIVIFDDSKTHRAFNYSETDERIVLIVDIVRPAQLPKGTATGGHSDELDSFIQQFANAR